MRLKLYNFILLLLKSLILSVLTWSTFPTAHSAPLEATQLTLNCKYEITTYNSYDYYTCTAIEFVNNRQDAEIAEVNGKHMDGYDSSKVEALIIKDQNVTFLPLKFGEVFENLVRFEVRNSSLGEILKDNFDKMDLKVLKIKENPIDKIPGDAFEDLKNLEEVELSGNKIESFEDETFIFNEKIKVLFIDGNKIKELSTSLLKNLTDLKKFSVQNNEIHELAEDLFENNKNLEAIFFTNNSLSKISPKITQNIENLQYFDFYGNPCLKDLSSFNELSFNSEQLEGLFESYCFKSDEDATDMPNETTDEPETTLEPSEKPGKDLKVPETSTSTLTTIQATDATETTVNDTPMSDTTTDKIKEEPEVDEAQIIKDLNAKIEDLQKQVEVLIKNQNLTNSIVDKIETTSEYQAVPSTEKPFSAITKMTEVSTQFPLQDLTLPTPATNINQHRDHEMSPEDVETQLNKVCTEWIARNKSEANKPSTIDNELNSAENITVKGFIRDDRRYLIIKGTKVENETAGIEYEKIIEEKDIKIGELETKIKEMESKVVENDGKMGELENQIKEKDEKMAALEAQVKGLIAQNEENLAKVKESQKNLEDQQLKFDKFTAKIENQVKDVFKEQNNQEASDINQDDIVKSFENVEPDSETSTAAFTTKQSTAEKPKTSTEATQSLDAPSNSTEPPTTSQESSLDTLEAQISILLTRIDKLILKNSKKSSRLSYLDESLKNCQDNKFSLALDLKLNSMDMQDRNKTLTIFKTELEACNNKTSELETASRNYKICSDSNVKHMNEIVELQATKRDLQGDKTECLEKIKALETQNGEQKVEIEELKGQISENKEKVEELEKNTEELIGKIEDLEKENGEQSEKIKELEQQNEGHEEKIKELEEENSNQKDQISQLEEQNSSQKDQIENLETENSSKTDKIKELQELSATKTAEINDLKSQESKLKAQNENREKDVRNCQAQVTNLKKETDLLKTKNADLKSKTNNLKTQNANKTAEISTCRQAYQEFKIAHDDLFYKNKEFGTRIQALTSQLTTCQESLTMYSTFPINCEIENIEGENSCVARNVIAVYPNMLVHLADPRNSNIKMLQIVNSKFRFITNSIFEQFTDLRTLEIIKSELLDLNDQKIQSSLLTNLRIEGNFIQQIPNDAFYGVPNLQNLILANNEIEGIQDLAFRGLPNLRKLDLRENKISTLNVNVFYYLQALTHLSLSSNRLRELPGGLLASQRFLQVAKFDSNPINYIGEELLHYSNELQKVYFDGTCVRGTYNGIDETNLRIKNYCQRKN